MLDKNKIGHNFPTFTVTVERRWLRSFAKAIGESNPIYMDENAACEAGYRTLPAPPTFAMALDQESSEFLPFVPLLDIDISRFCMPRRSSSIWSRYAQAILFKWLRKLQIFLRKRVVCWTLL